MTDNIKLYEDTIEPGSFIPPYKDPAVSNLDSTDAYTESFYASVLSGSEEPVDTFEAMRNEFETQGYSSLVNNVKHSIKEKNDIENAALMETIIADESIPREHKSVILKNYQLTNEVEPNLKDEYLKALSLAEMMEKESVNDDYLVELDFNIQRVKGNQEIQYTEEMIDNIYNPKVPITDKLLAKGKEMGQKALDFFNKKPEQVFAQMLANATDPLHAREAVNLTEGILGVPQFFAELASTMGIAYTKQQETLSRVALSGLTGMDFLKEAHPEVKWGEIYEKVTNFTGKYGYQQFVTAMADKVITPEDREGGLVHTVFKTIDDVAQYIGEKVSPNDPERVKIPLLFSMFFLHKAKGLFKKEIQEQPLKKAVREAVEERTTTKQAGFEPKLASPFVEAVNTNGKTARNLSEILLNDITGESWKAMNITPTEFFQNFLGPNIFERNFKTNRYFDGFETMRTMFSDALKDRTNVSASLESSLVDVPERLKFAEVFIEESGNILKDPNIKMIPSSLNVRPYGTGVFSRVDFRKSSTEYFPNTVEVIDAAKKVWDKVTEGMLAREAQRKAAKEEFKRSVDDSKVLIEEISATGEALPNPMTVPDFIKKYGESPKDGKFNIVWEKTGDFMDTIRANTEGFGNYSWLDKKMLKTLYKFPKLWNAFFIYGRLGKNVQMMRDIGGLRALGLMEGQITQLVNLIKNPYGKNVVSNAFTNNARFRNDLATVYEQLRSYDILELNRTVGYNDIVKMLNYNAPHYHVNALLEAVKITQNLNYSAWKFNNLYEINRFVKAGYKNSIEYRNPFTKEIEHIMVKSMDETLALDLSRTIEVFDPAKGEGVVLDGGHYAFIEGKHYITNSEGIPTQQVVRFHKGVENAKGETFNYGIIDVGTTLKGTPPFVTRYRPNYMPLLVDNTVFVRRYPRKKKVDGKLLEPVNVLDMVPYKEAVAAFYDRKSADNYVNTAKLNREDYYYAVEKAAEITADVFHEHTMLQENALRNSRRRGDNLEYVVHEDPLTSIIDVNRMAGTKFVQQMINEQLKTGWIKRWGGDPNISIIENKGNLTASQKAATRGYDALDMEGAQYSRFPLTREQIEQRGNKKEAHTQALEEYDAIVELTKGHELDLVSIGINRIAEFMGEVAYQNGWKKVEKAFLKLERNPSYPVDIITKIPVTAYVSIAMPIKHWIQQPVAGLSYMATASKGNPIVFTEMMANAISMVQTMAFENLGNKKYSTEVLNHINSITARPKELGGGKYNVRSYEDNMLLLRYGYETGLFNMSQHTLNRGLFNSKSPELGAGVFRQQARNFTDFMSKIGLQTGEFMHRLAGLESSLYTWQQKNPGKSWKNPKALEEIFYGARQLTHSMDPMGSNFFQRNGFIKPFAMLQTFQARAGEAILNGDATPFTGKQRAAQTGFNIALYGVDKALPFGAGALVYNAIQEFFGQQVADAVGEANLIDITIQSALDSQFPTYMTDEDGEQKQVFTTTRYSEYLSPYGSEAGLFYYQAAKSFLSTFTAMEFDETHQGNVAATYWKNSFANVNLMARQWGLNKRTDETIIS